MRKYDIKLVALDLDGTTLDSKGRLADRTKNALEAATRKDVYVIIATGRAYSALPEEIFEVFGIKYAVTSNGASVMDMVKNEQVYSNCIDACALERTVEVLRQHDFMMEFFTGGRAYVEKEVYDKVRGMGFTEKHKKYIMTTRKPVVGLLDFAMYHKERIENINVNFENQADRSMMREVLSKLENVTLTSSFDHNLEIGGETTSKAEAISVMCKKLGISMRNVMVCGDSPNDLAMMKIAGLSIAVGNAKDEVKEAAGYITLTNDECGVAVAIEKFVLLRRTRKNMVTENKEKIK